MLKALLFVVCAAQACASELPARTWAGFKPGSWKTVTSALTDDKGAVLRAGTTRWRLLKVDARESILEMTYLGDLPRKMETRQQIRVPHDQLLYPGAAGKVTARVPEKLDVCGEIVPCERIDATTPEGSVTSWISTKVPGLVVKQIHRTVQGTDTVDAMDWQAR